MHKIVRLTGATNCVEMGTCLGISASYLAAALPEGGRLVTMEGSPGVADIATDTLRTLVPGRAVEIRRGPFHETLNVVLREMSPIDFVFVDGHHEEQATEQYFRQLLPNMQQNGVIVFDDIRWSPGMKKAWSHIRAQAPGVCVDLGTLGLVLLP
ncbi:MAG TPA: class I SAM-dependent methyltransferase [Devosiaceae bacterium]|nr:class I SAM-dependent methyltransferase [Devosiaceae bacterium]